MKGEKQEKRAGAGNKDYQSYGPSTALQAGTAAPDFTLHTTPDQTVSLTDFRGRPVILMFYPADWSPVCGDQVVLYNELLPEFQSPRRGGLARHLGGRRLVSPRFRPRSQIEVPADGGL